MTVLEKLNVILNTKSIFHAITDKLQTKSPEGGEAIPLVDAFGISNHMLGGNLERIRYDLSYRKRKRLSGFNQRGWLYPCQF